MPAMLGLSDMSERGTLFVLPSRESRRSSSFWAQLHLWLFLSDQLRCGHVRDTLKFSQDQPSKSTLKLHPPGLLTTLCLWNSLVLCFCFGTCLSALNVWLSVAFSVHVHVCMPFYFIHALFWCTLVQLVSVRMQYNETVCAILNEPTQSILLECVFMLLPLSCLKL